MSVRSCKAREKRGTDALGGFGFCPNAGVRAKNIVDAVAIALRLDNRNAVRAVKLPSCNTKKLTGAVYHRGFLRSRLLTVCLKSKRDWIILVFPELQTERARTVTLHLHGRRARALSQPEETESNG